YHVRYQTMATIDAPAPGGLSVPGEELRRAAPRRRSVWIRGREYPVLLPSIRDPRLHVAAVLLTLQVLGQTVLDFRLSVAPVLAFVVLGPQYTEPQDLWWIPMGLWMIVTYAVLIGGGLLIAWELKLLGLVAGYMAAFAASVAIALAPVPDHCMVASWHATALCGTDLWKILVTSPEVLIFAFFMVPDPRTVPEGQDGRFVFGAIVAI